MIEARERVVLGPDKIAALEAWVGPGCVIECAELLSGGAIQQNWLLAGSLPMPRRRC
jgi:hypothetical protein